VDCRINIFNLTRKHSDITSTVKPVLRGHDLWGKEKWSFKTGDLLKEVQFIWNVLWLDKKVVTFYHRWLLNRGDHMGRFDYIFNLTRKTFRHYKYVYIYICSRILLWLKGNVNSWHHEERSKEYNSTSPSLYHHPHPLHVSILSFELIWPKVFTITWRSSNPETTEQN
jgi:hypothetical protein